MAGLFGGGAPKQEPAPAPPPPAPAPPPPVVMPQADPEAQKREAERQLARRRAGSTTRAATIIGSDSDTLG